MSFSRWTYVSRELSNYISDTFSLERTDERERGERELGLWNVIGAICKYLVEVRSRQRPGGKRAAYCSPALTHFIFK